MVKEIIMRKKTYASPVIAVYSFCEETPLMNMSPGIGQHNPGKRKPGPQAGNTRSEGWGSDFFHVLPLLLKSVCFLSFPSLFGRKVHA